MGLFFYLHEWLSFMVSFHVGMDPMSKGVSQKKGRNYSDCSVCGREP